MKEKIYNYLTKIPQGRVVTYGQIACFLGNVHLSRYVGNVLHGNTDGTKYPCYKVVSSNGRLSQNYAFGGLEEQKRRLEADGIWVEKDRVLLSRYQWQPEETAWN